MKVLKVKKPNPRIEYYEDKSNKWRWRFISNGHIMADSGQGYASKQGCEDAIESVISHFKSLNKSSIVEL